MLSILIYLLLSFLILFYPLELYSSRQTMSVLDRHIVSYEKASQKSALE